jgi:hypothetical protein
MSALRSLRASNATSVIEKQPLSNDNNDIAKQQNAALSSVKMCYKMAF